MIACFLDFDHHVHWLLYASKKGVMQDYLSHRRRLIHEDRAARLDSGLQPTVLSTTADTLVRKIRAEEAMSVWRAENKEAGRDDNTHLFPGMAFLTGAVLQRWSYELLCTKGGTCSSGYHRQDASLQDHEQSTECPSDDDVVADDVVRFPRVLCCMRTWTRP